MSVQPYVLVIMDDSFRDVTGLMVVDAENAGAAAEKGYNVVLALPVPKHPARPEDEPGIRFALSAPRGSLIPSHLIRLMADHERVLWEES